MNLNMFNSIKDYSNKILISVTGVIAFVVVFLVAGEVFLRIVYNPPYKFSLDKGADCFDSRFGLHMCPSFRTDIKRGAILSKKPEIKQAVFSNSYGLRDKEPARFKSPDTFRVMFLGDSYVAAWNVLLEETLPYQFKEKINAVDLPSPYKNIDVINAGISGFCTYAETEWYVSIGEKIGPDLVFLVFTANDITAYKHNTRTRVSGDNYNLPEGMEDKYKRAGIMITKPFNLDIFLTMNSYFYQFTKFWIIPAFGTSSNPVEINSKALSGEDTQPVHAQNIINAASDLKRLNDQLLGQGKKLVVIMLPAELEVRDDVVDGAFFPAIRKIGRSNNIPVIDALPRLRAARMSGKKVYGNVYDGDFHCHANGLEIVAELAAEWFHANFVENKI